MEATGKKEPRLFFERLTSAALHFFRLYRIPFAASILFGLLAHGFAFTNKLINHDEIYNLFGKGATVDSGRWGLGLLDSIFPNYSMPWIYGIVTVLLIAISVCLILHIFSIKSGVLQILLAGCVMVFPVWVSTFSFMFTSSSYGVSFLLAVLSVFFLRKKHILYIPLALGCGIFSVAIYQAYIAVIAGLLVLILIQDLLLEEDLFPVLRRGCFYVLFLALTLGLYYIAAQLVLILTDLQFNPYAAERNSFDLTGIFHNITVAYTHFFQAFKTGENALIPTHFVQRLHYVCLIASCILLLVLFTAKKMKFPRVVFLLALIAIFPLAASCMYLFTPEAAVHTLVRCGFVTIYVLFIMLANLCLSLPHSHRLSDLLRRVTLNIVVFTLSIILVSNTYFANEAYLGLHLQYETTYAFYTSLLSDIRMTPEFDEDTKLAVIGQWTYPDYFFRKFEFTYHLFGHLSSTPGEYSMDRFMEYYLGFPIPFASEEEKDVIRQTEEYAQMKPYPYYGSIQMFDDTLVVKLS